MYIRYVRKVWQLREVIFMLRSESKQKIDTYGYDADNSGMDSCPWARDDVA